MGLRGPAPKDPAQQANKSRAAADRARMRVVESEPAQAPCLPPFMPGGDDWPVETMRWWESWTQNPLTDDYRESDWLDLLDCALIHGRLWGEDAKASQQAAGELRHRMARHGATREDRARLRITFATADFSEHRAQATVNPANASTPTARERRAGLRSVKPVQPPTGPDNDDPAPF